jgi:hypothetical protein
VEQDRVDLRAYKNSRNRGSQESRTRGSCKEIGLTCPHETRNRIDGGAAYSTRGGALQLLTCEDVRVHRKQIEQADRIFVMKKPKYLVEKNEKQKFPCSNGQFEFVNCSSITEL